jgi:hypothetical protein
MDVTPLSASIVVLGEGLDPAKLRPSVLKSKGVVDGSWVVDEDSLALAIIGTTVGFTNGYVFSVQPNRLHVQHYTYGESPLESLVPAQTKAYLDYVNDCTRFQAIGINFDHIIESTDANDFLTQRLLSARFGHDAPIRPTKSSVRLVYPEPDGSKLVLLFTTGTITLSKKNVTKTGVYIQANYHFDLDPTDRPKIIEVLDQYQSFVSGVSERIRSILAITE